VVSEAVPNQPNGTVESTTTGDVKGTSTVMEDVFGSDEESSLLQKQPKNQKSTQKQRNVSINVTAEI
jgi:hypothetical protein